MSKNHQVLKWLMLLMSLVLFTVLGQRATTAQAATIAGDQYITNASVQNGPDFKPVDTINVHYHLEFGNTDLHSGDVVTVSLPDNLKSSKSSTFDVLGPDNKTVIGQGTVTKGGDKIEVTLNEKVEGLTDKELDLYIATKYNGTSLGEQNVLFPNNDQDVINIVSNEANLSKKGTIQDNGTVKWTILVNRQELTLKNLQVKDTIGANQTMIKGLTISEAYWTDELHTTYKREQTQLVEGKDYTVTYHDGGFDVKFNETVQKMMTIDYYTTIDNPAETHDGYIYRNQAIMSWGGGTSGTPNSEEANGKVSTTDKNSGTGNGANGGSEPENPEPKPNPDPDPKPNPDPDPKPNPDPDPKPNPKPNPGEPDPEKPTTEPNENGDVDGDKDTGTIDTDGGTDAAKPTPDDKKQPVTKKTATTTHAHQRAARATATTPRSHNAVAVAKSARHTANGRLPQTNERTTPATVMGLALLSGSVLVAIYRRYF